MTAQRHPHLVNMLRAKLRRTCLASTLARYKRRKKLHAAGRLRCTHGIPCNHDQAAG